MHNCEAHYSEQIIDGCQVQCTIIDFPELHPTNVIVAACNPTSHTVLIDLTKLRIKIWEWYYYIPWNFWIEADNFRRVEINYCELRKVDNLTFVEEVAKEKQLI